MSHSTPQSRVRRIAAAVVIAVLIVPAAGYAEDEDKFEPPPPAPAPVEPHWYDGLRHNTNVGVDLLIIRPLSAVSLAAGAALFVPAAILTAPNGTESMKDAYDRFVREPGEYFYSRPLGDF
jgi:hypothetical protein